MDPFCPSFLDADNNAIMDPIDFAQLRAWELIPLAARGVGR
jgi:hypothetical protein